MPERRISFKVADFCGDSILSQTTILLLHQPLPAIICIRFGFFDFVEQGLHVGLQDVGEFVEDGVFGVVDAGVVEDEGYILLKHLSLCIEPLLQLLVDFFEPHWIGDDGVVVRGLLLADSDAEGPGVFVVVEGGQDIVTLLLKGLLLGALGRFVALQGPPGLQEARHLGELKILAAAGAEIERLIDFAIDDLLDLGDHEVTLHFDGVRYILIINADMNLTLHHGRPAVVLDVAFPARLRHLQVLREALLTEVLDGVVVGVGHEVLDADRLGMRLEPIHESRSVPLDLLGGRDCQENDFGEPLTMERSKDAATKNRRHAAIMVASTSRSRRRILFPNNHGLVLPVHGEADDVVPRHFRQLLRNYIF